MDSEDAPDVAAQPVAFRRKKMVWTMHHSNDCRPSPQPVVPELPEDDWFVSSDDDDEPPPRHLSLEEELRHVAARADEEGGCLEEDFDQAWVDRLVARVGAAASTAAATATYHADALDVATDVSAATLRTIAESSVEEGVSTHLLIPHSLRRPKSPR